ncbi:hypothetical protein HDV05_001325, partial [Chytridiales sp. JEL 0842]
MLDYVLKMGQMDDGAFVLKQSAIPHFTAPFNASRQGGKLSYRATAMMRQIASGLDSVVTAAIGTAFSLRDHLRNSCMAMWQGVGNRQMVVDAFVNDKDGPQWNCEALNVSRALVNRRGYTLIQCINGGKSTAALVKERMQQDPDFEKSMRAIWINRGLHLNASIKNRMAIDPEYAAKMKAIRIENINRTNAIIRERKATDDEYAKKMKEMDIERGQRISAIINERMATDLEYAEKRKEMLVEKGKKTSVHTIICSIFFPYSGSASFRSLTEFKL